MEQGIIKVTAPIPFTANYVWSVGFPMEKFIKALKNKKLLASKCPNCGYTYLPPRNRCGKCYSKIGDKDIIELKGEGEVVSWTVAAKKLNDNGRWKNLDKPQVIAAVKFSGADSTVVLPLLAKPDQVSAGMKVKLQWRKETKGELADLEGVKPAKAK